MDKETMSSEHIRDMEWFKSHSLLALRASLLRGDYPNYPTQRLTIANIDLNSQFLPYGPWHVDGTDTVLPSDEESTRLAEEGHSLDLLGRPLHPWLPEMLVDTAVGAVTGKGFYWNWGPNKTADPIIIRRDLSEPHVLLIERGDGTGLALPGGFKNKGELDVEAAMREGWEETGIDVSQLPHDVKQIYKGPLADLRVTAHAWPETTAFCFELDLSSKDAQKQLVNMMSTTRNQRLIRSVGRFAFTERLNRLPWEGHDDAKKAQWIPISELDNQLFGSHRLLIQMALASYF